MESSAHSAAEEARQYLVAGDLPAAEQAARVYLADHPNDCEALLTLGVALQLNRRYGEAESTFSRLATLQPGEPAHWVNLGTARRCDGRAEEALGAYLRAAQLGEGSPDFLYNVALAHMERRDFIAARSVLERALLGAPRDAAIHAACAKACYEALESDAALAALSGWQGFDNLDAATAAEIAFLLMNLGESREAELAMERALADPDCPASAALTLVRLLERVNRLDDARRLFEAVSSNATAAPDRDDMRLAEAQLAQRAGEHERASLLFRQSLGERLPTELRHYRLFPLARSLDALGRYDDAWDALRQAHESQMAYIAASAPAIMLRGAPTMEITQYGCAAGDIEQWSDDAAPSVDDSPIFIVAFPRSGTTLLELTLDAHPALASMDEQPFLQNALDDLRQLPGITYPEHLAGLDARQLQFLRARYWDRVLDKVGLEPGQRLIDKNPLNLLRVPVIRRLFPRAKVIMVVRDPRDVLLSCYMQHFRAPDFAAMCRDLPTLAIGLRRAFDFWYAQTQLLRPDVLELRYERFVTGHAQHVRDLCRFLELPWSDAMLDAAEHARRKGYISTPSYSQVVQPVHARSVGRWPAYARHFSAVDATLRPLLERWGY